MDEDDDILLLEWEDDSPWLLNDIDGITSSSSSSIDSKNKLQNSQVSVKGETFFKQIDEDLDYAFALSLQSQYDEEVKENIQSESKKSIVTNSQSSKPLSIVDDQWELLDPHPDIHALFLEYDKKFFYGKLKYVEVKWSPRMTLCAGVCSYEGRGGLCSIRLSVPLLKLRPRRDLVETLLHEMIHAYLFVTHNNKDRDGHGPEFQSHMNRINKESGTRITVYHSFHDEVDLYRQHWWKCNGPCKDRRPYYGLLKRATNRPPGPNDNWWADHQSNCGGTFIKVKEPDNYGKKKSTKRKIPAECSGSPSDIRNFLKNDVSQDSGNKSRSLALVSKSSSISRTESLLIGDNKVVTLNDKGSLQKKVFIPFQGTGQKLGGSNSLNFSSHLKGNVSNKDVASASSSYKNLSETSLSSASKVPRLSNSQGNLSKDQKPTVSISSNKAAKNFVQSPIEKFLFSKTGSSDSDSVNKNIYKNQSKEQKSDALKVSCPVCSILIEESKINSHLDTCLSN